MKVEVLERVHGSVKGKSLEGKNPKDGTDMK
jgi:hypothetical protein